MTFYEADHVLGIDSGDSTGGEMQDSTLSTLLDNVNKVDRFALDNWERLFNLLW
jgi:hypothetical protein